MSKIGKQHIVFFLLLCMVVTLVPFNLLHNHSEDTHISHENIETENDPCHINIYHKESLKNQCKHETHIAESQEECEFCTFITNRRFEFTVEEQSSITLITFFEIPQITKCFLVLQYSNESTLGRAPPLA